MYGYEIEPRPTALAGDDRLYLYGPDPETGEEIELGGGVFPSGAGRSGDPGSVCRGSMGWGFLARLAAPLLKAAEAHFIALRALRGVFYFLVNIRYIIRHKYFTIKCLTE